MGTTSTSIMDHCLVSEYLISHVHTYDSIDDDGLVPNLSDHLPVRLSVSLTCMTSAGTDLHWCSLPAFYKVSAETIFNYQPLVTSYLLCIAVLNETSTLNTDIENFYKQIVNACVKTTALTIPSANNYHTR